MKTKPTLLMLRGYPASGKTTYARKLMEAEPDRYVRVCREDLRNMLFFGDERNCHTGEVVFWQGDNAKFGTLICDWIIKQAWTRGKDVIVDSTNLSVTEQRHWRDLCRNHAKFVEHDMNVDIEECKRRNKLRGSSVVSDLTYDRLAENMKGKK